MGKKGKKKGQAQAPSSAGGDQPGQPEPGPSTPSVPEPQPEAPAAQQPQQKGKKKKGKQGGQAAGDVSQQQQQPQQPPQQPQQLFQQPQQPFQQPQQPFQQPQQHFQQPQQPFQQPQQPFQQQQGSWQRQAPPQQQLPQQPQWRPRQPPPQVSPQHPQGFPPGFQQQQFPPGFQPPMPRGPPGLGPQQQFGPPQGYWGPPTQQLPPQGVGVQQQFQQQPATPGGPPPGLPHQQSPGSPLSPQQQQRPGFPPQQQRQGHPQQQQQKQRQGQQQRQQPQQRQGGPPPQQQQQQRPPQQQQQQQQQQRPQQAAAPPKEPSPPLGGAGDRLALQVAVKPGTKGRKIPVESNHLALNVGTLTEAIHYDVAITPDTPKTMLRDVMNIFGQKHYPKRHPAFDGRKNLYTPTMLPFGESLSDVIKVEGENRTKEFKVEVKFARTVDLSPLHDMLRTKKPPQDALQCLDIVLRNAPSNRCITAGRCFFTPPANQIISLGDGMEMYYGFYQSAIRGWKPLLNVDVAHKAFPSALSILDLILELGSDFRYQMRKEDLRRPLHDNTYRNLEKFLRQLKVKYEITGQSGSKRIQRVNGLGAPPSQAQFKLDNGQVTTVENYFRDVKRVRLQYPHLPTLWVGAKDRDSKILLPLEFCSVVEGQSVNRKMNENQTSAMIKKSATSTDIRKQKIMASLDKAKYNNDPCIREFGFSVNNQFEKLEARVLEPPDLLYRDQSVVRPKAGVWRPDRSKFLVGATVKKWTIVCVTRQPCRPDQLNMLADMIYRMAGTSGMQITAKALPPFGHISGRQSVNDIVQYFKPKQDFDLIFVVVPNSGSQYSYVKQAAELNVGCLTQCIKERTLNKLNNQTVLNILLKVNSKLNGTNHTFNVNSRPPIMNRPCMIMGADVTHPSPDARDIPSVAAVTASHDPKAFQYNICWRLQPPKVEIIEDLCNITTEQLRFFHRKTGFKPERIVFFRDGVSEGQFHQVQKAEITAIRKACKQLQPDGYEPSITFLVVQKRHHTRLFPTNPRDSEDRNMNVPAGTCVDTMITNPMMQDFYLVSHASIQGVAKPTKYCTLWDENKMSNDDIEELTYHLCHMFTRCNRSVSYPAPTYYAHLAAARAKVYIENDKLNMDELKKHQSSYEIKDCILREKPMFFV